MFQRELNILSKTSRVLTLRCYAPSKITHTLERDNSRLKIYNENWQALNVRCQGLTPPVSCEVESRNRVLHFRNPSLDIVTIIHGIITNKYGKELPMLEGLFGNITIERIFFFLATYKEGYPLGMAKTFEVPVNRIQQQLKRLEDSGIVASRLVGKVRLYTFNPRYPFLKELEALIATAFEFIPDSEKEKFYRRRTRPRRAGKPQ